MLLDLFEPVFGFGSACRLHQSGIDSHAFINGKAILMELFEKCTIDLNQCLIRKALSEPGKGAVIRRCIIQGHIKERFKGNTIIDLAFKFRIGFYLKPFLQKHTFKQKQRRVSPFSSIDLAGLIVCDKKVFNWFPVNGLIHLGQEN